MQRLLIVLLLTLSSCALESTHVLSSVRSSIFQVENDPKISWWNEVNVGSLDSQLKIAVVTESFGPIRPGKGMGSIYQSLAYLMHNRGHHVHVLLVGHRLAEYDDLSFPFPVSWVPFRDHLEGGAMLTASSSVYNYLKTGPKYDVITFPDWNSPGFVSMQAKWAGIHFQDTTMLLGIHGGHQWVEQGNMQASDTYENLVGEFMERQSVLLADVVWTQSADILHFLSSKGWKWSPNQPVFQLTLPAGPEVVDAWQPKDLNPWEFDELVYFGAMQESKGVGIFVDALEKGRAKIKVGRVTFLGAAGNHTVIASIKLRLGKLYDLQFMTNTKREGALKYLVQSNRLTVIPSLYDNGPNTVYESLYLGIPMICSTETGVPSALVSQNQLFGPTSVELLNKLQELEDARRFPRAATSLDPEIVGKSWISFFERHANLASEKPSETPLVSVVITSHNRAKMLLESIESIEEQTYENIELIVVDDGSTDVDVLGVLDTIEQKHTVIRQENKYLGAARNAGAQKARGDYMLFLDDDNIALAKMVSTQITAIQRSGASIAVNGHSVWTSGTPLTETSLWVPVGPAPLAGLMGNPFGNANFLISRNAFLDLGGFTTDREGWEDYEFHAKAVLSGLKYVVIPESLMLYRIHDRQFQMAFSSDTQKGYERVLRAYSSVLKAAGVPVESMVEVRSTSGHRKARQTDPCQDITVRQVICGNTVTFPVSVTLAPVRRRRIRQPEYTLSPTTAPKTPIVRPSTGGNPVISNPITFPNPDGTTTTSFDVNLLVPPSGGPVTFEFEFPCDGVGCTPTVCTTTYTYTPKLCCCYTTKVSGSPCVPRHLGSTCESGIGICDRADINADGVVDVIDLAENLVRWNHCDCPVPNCQFDYDYNGRVDIADLANTLNVWGRDLYRPFLCCCLSDPVTLDCYNVPSALCEVESNSNRKRKTFFGCRADLPLQ